MSYHFDPRTEQNARNIDLQNARNIDLQNARNIDLQNARNIDLQNARHLEFNTLTSADLVKFEGLDAQGVKRMSLTAKMRAVGFHLTINMVAIFAIALVSFGMMNVAFAGNEVVGSDARPVSYVRPNDMNMGALLLPSKKQGQYVEAPRLSSDVDITVNGPIARVSVTQRFENPSEGWVEGIYVFPLPEDSAIDTLKMRVGDRLIEGVVKVREEARKIFEQAKREGKKAALLEQQRDNLFTNAVANIGPGDVVIVNIEYQQTVRQDSGLFSLRFPMVVPPR